MTAKEEITAGIREVEARLESLLPRILANLETPLPEGSWTVHDAVCHMAADAHAVPRWLQRIDAFDTGRSPRPPGFDLDGHNQRNIDERKHKPVDVVVQEIRDGLDADVEAVARLDAALLQREIPNFRGELTRAADMLSFTTARHNHNHLDDIERATALSTLRGG